MEHLSGVVRNSSVDDRQLAGPWPEVTNLLSGQCPGTLRPLWKGGIMPKSPIDNKPALVQLGNGLAPNRRKAIMSNNDDPVQWHINVALQGDELRFETWKAIENAAFNTDILIFIQASVS